MAPVALADHSIDDSDPAVVATFLDYAPLLRALRGRTWLLVAHVINITLAETLRDGLLPSLVPCSESDKQQLWTLVTGADGTAIESVGAAGMCLVVYSPNFSPTECHAVGGEATWM